MLNCCGLVMGMSYLSHMLLPRVVINSRHYEQKSQQQQVRSRLFLFVYSSIIFMKNMKVQLLSAVVMTNVKVAHPNYIHISHTCQISSLWSPSLFFFFSACLIAAEEEPFSHNYVPAYYTRNMPTP